MFSPIHRKQQCCVSTIPCSATWTVSQMPVACVFEVTFLVSFRFFFCTLLAAAASDVCLTGQFCYSYSTLCQVPKSEVLGLPTGQMTFLSPTNTIKALRDTWYIIYFWTRKVSLKKLLWLFLFVVFHLFSD